MSSWIFVSRVGTLSVVLQSVYWVKLIKTNLKYLTELHIYDIKLRVSDVVHDIYQMMSLVHIVCGVGILGQYNMRTSNLCCKNCGISSV